MTLTSKKPMSKYSNKTEADKQRNALLGVNRYERAQKLVKNVTQISPMDFKVKSQTSKKVYRVNISHGNYYCNCNDARGGDHDCKHILAVKLYLGVEIDLSPQVDYHTYTVAQCHEGEFVKIYLKDLADTVETPVNAKGGKPPIPYNEQIYNAVMKVYSKRSSRRCYSDTIESHEDNYITHLPCFNLVNKFLEREDITPILYRLVRLSALPLTELETSFSVDSSGFSTSSFDDWCDVKHKPKEQRRERSWVKCHIMCGNLTNVITDVIVTENHGDDTGDVSNFVDLVKNTSKFFNVKEVCADKGYSDKKNFAAVEDVDAEPYIMFKNSDLGKDGRWAIAYANLLGNRDRYVAHYGNRNNVESTFGALKTKMGERLLTKKFVSQRNELLCKIIAYNLTVLCEAYFMEGITPVFRTAEGVMA